ncbi:MAG: hypothetical protein ACTS2F_10775 [Thainema sp.]
MVGSIQQFNSRQAVEDARRLEQEQALASTREQFWRQIPNVVTDDNRVALANARARQEVLGEEPDDGYANLVGRVADEVQQGYQDAYERAGVEPEAAAIAAVGQQHQFLGEPVSTDEAEAISLAEATVEAKRKEYGRTINNLKEHYRNDVAGLGSRNLMDSAAQIRAGQQVYGNEPTEKQARLLQAADIQRQKGVARQLWRDYKTSGVPNQLAQAAGDIKARDYVFGGEQSAAQERRVEQADRYLNSPEGQLKRVQAQQYLEDRVGRAYEEGRTTQALEAAGVDADLAAKAARIQAQTGGDPESPEDQEILQAAYASADGLASPMETDIAVNAEQFMNVANEAGVTSSLGATTIAQGNTYMMSRTAGITVVENQETGGFVAVRDGTVLDTDGMSEQDQIRFQTLGQVSPEDLQATQHKQTAEQHRSAGMEMD